MLRIITGFLLLIISQMSFASVTTIPATATPNVKSYYFTLSGDAVSSESATISSDVSSACSKLSTYYQSLHSSYLFNGVYSAATTGCSIKYAQAYTGIASGSTATTSFRQSVTQTVYSCSAGYNLSDSAGNADSSGSYCTKESCTTKSGTNQMVEISNGETAPVMGCYQGCSGTNLQYLYDNKAWTCAAGSGLSCSFNMQFDGNTCTVSSSSNSSASSSSSGDGCGGNGSSTGTVNGHQVTVCNSAPSSSSSDSNTNTSTSSATGTDAASSGLGTDAGTPETNTSGSQNSTVGGGVGGLGGDGFGGGGSTGGGGGTGAATGTNGTGATGTGTNSGSSSGTSGTGTNSGSSSGTSGTGTASGSSSGSGSGASGSGTGSGTGSGSGAGTGSATSGAGGTDSGTPAEEEEESGNGGGSFTAPGKGTDYLADLFGADDLAALASQKTALTDKINQKRADIKSLFNITNISMSGAMSENRQEIKGASVDLSGKSLFDKFSIVAAAFYLCAIVSAIYIVMGGNKS